MKKIIEGKIYNTETAEKIANYWNGLSASDSRNCEETLYRTKKGAWFVHGEGGAMTQWSESNGDCSWGSSGIRVLSDAEALDWCESHGVDADKVSEYFQVEEG